MERLPSPHVLRGALRIVGVIAAIGLIITGCGTPPPTALPTEIVAATPSPAVLPTDTPPPSPLPTDTSSPKPPAPTTPSPPDTPTSAPPATDTPVRSTATPPPTKRPTKTPGITYPAPTLVAPQEKDATSVHGQVTFQWSYPRALRPNEAFQVLMWMDDQPHLGVAELWTDTQQTINLDAILPQRGGPGVYFWTVVVREKGTEKLLSPEAPAWQLGYTGPADPCASCDCQANCRSGNCNPCCQQCCNGCQ